MSIIPVILDTSTFRSLSKDKLEKYNSGNFKIMISCYTFFELLCHLDENKDWEKSKGNVCKCSSVGILDDPFAIVEAELYYQTKQLKNHVPESQLIPGILKLLSNSSSIYDFYRSEFSDEKGQIRSIIDCSKEAEGTLKEKESEYLDFIKKIMDCIKQENYDVNSEKDCCKIIEELIEGRVIDSKKNSIQQKNIRNKVFNLCYLYYSYIFERAKKLIIHGNKNPDKNDYEDSCICLHLRLDRPFIFVTNDKGIYEAINNSIERLKNFNKSFIRNCHVYWGIGINL